MSTLKQKSWLTDLTITIGEEHGLKSLRSPHHVNSFSICPEILGEAFLYAADPGPAVVQPLLLPRDGSFRYLPCRRRRLLSGREVGRASPQELQLLLDRRGDLVAVLDLLFGFRAGCRRIVRLGHAVRAAQAHGVGARGFHGPLDERGSPESGRERVEIASSHLFAWRLAFALAIAVWLVHQFIPFVFPFLFLSPLLARHSIFNVSPERLVFQQRQLADPVLPPRLGARKEPTRLPFLAGRFCRRKAGSASLQVLVDALQFALGLFRFGLEVFGFGFDARRGVAALQGHLERVAVEVVGPAVLFVQRRQRWVVVFVFVCVEPGSASSPAQERGLVLAVPAVDVAVNLVVIIVVFIVGVFFQIRDTTVGIVVVVVAFFFFFVSTLAI
ncbi:hypothetical protein PG985_005224 [Apiospora marii]|uniref:Uncharacterized protein n=1 Tax=Apiospora marii TaxID=335849 RepID=A0ABR1SBE4_9PEZI